MKSNQRVVKSIPDRAGKVYNKTGDGGGRRTTAAVRYMDQHEQTQLYAPNEQGQVVETDRHEAAQKIEDTASKYQQHVVFTTDLKSGEAYVDEREYAQQVAESVRAVRPDAEIYAVSVHADKDGEGQIHAHVTFGTDTTIRKGQLAEYREHAHRHEEHIKEHSREAERSPAERQWAEQYRTTPQPIPSQSHDQKEMDR